MKHIFLINRFSLKHRTDKMVEALKKVCKRRKLDFEIEINNDIYSTEDIINKYKNAKHIIYAIGGDGILNRVMNAILKTKNTFSYIPYGSGNDFDRSAQELFHNGINEVDLIKINNMYCMNVVCFGIDAEIANKGTESNSTVVPREDKYIAAIISHFIHFKPFEFKIKSGMDKEEGLYSTITVCNGRYYGAGFHPNPHGFLDDGLMDAMIVDKMPKLQLINYILKLKKGKHESMLKVKNVKTSKMVIESPVPITANIDGEELTDTRFELKIEKKALKVYYDKDLIDEILKEVK